jgi:hypothetical protein
MHLKPARWILAGVAALLLSACGGGGGQEEPTNFFPSANAGSAQSVISGATVTLDGRASTDPDGSIAAYSWTQTSGAAVTLVNAGTAQPTFVAPTVVAFTTLAFRLVVTDNRGAQSAGATVTVSVSPTSAGVVTLSGTVRFARVQFRSDYPYGLNYADTVLQPAREVNLRVLDATSQTQMATGRTDSSGNYSIDVPGNSNVVMQVVAQTQRSGGAGASWNVRVQNGTGNLNPYNHTSAAFDTSAGVQNIDIPTGIGVDGTATGVRPSGAFAILDTIYTAIQAVVAVAPDTAFPVLYVDWGAQSTGTFFTTSNGQHIALLADLTEDTDEFDQHVVAHEFGHYVENNFSRSDSIGGSHSMGDRLDMRVAFGEGFGYAFAAIVLNNPDARDSFVLNGVHGAGGFNIEANPPFGGSGAGCWCSETSVWSILWDLHDPVSAPDNDNIQIGFAPIWQVMTGAQRTTPAMTSIFSFAEALKLARPGDAAGIDALLVAQNIDAVGINAFASTQTQVPSGTTPPLYASLVPGTPATVRSFGVRLPGPEQLYNKAGNHAFLRFVPDANGVANVRVVTSNANVAPDAADPDYWVFRSGVLVGVADSSPLDEPAQTETGSFNVTAGQTYIIDAYDCANGCDPEPRQGVAGDYNLTVTVTIN